MSKPYGYRSEGLGTDGVGREPSPQPRPRRIADLLVPHEATSAFAESEHVGRDGTRGQSADFVRRHEQWSELLRTDVCTVCPARCERVNLGVCIRSHPWSQRKTAG